MKKTKQTAETCNRMQVRGKFLFAGNEKFYIKGTTYGTFAPQADGALFPEPIKIEADFAQMAAHGFNAVRTYTVPPRSLLDAALTHGLKVMIGLPWHQYGAFLDNAVEKRKIIEAIVAGAQRCKNHPAVLCFTIGNEIPAPEVRWYGKSKIENFLKTAYRAVKAVDRHALVTYVNYPTTEYLNLDFLDFDCFNVYLETPEKLSGYVARLQNRSGDRPLVMAEIGLDSLRNGVATQAEVLQWQTNVIFGKGCAGMFFFSWTDEWWRGGSINDWDFGLVDRNRQPKPALYAVQKSIAAVPVAPETAPFISVIVCSYNGSATIKDCLDGLQQLDYPAFEVIVVNDGSQDNLADIVKQYPVRLVSTKNNGLSSARNTGLHHAAGDIVAYIDDDAYPDPHWLRYIAYAYQHSEYVCIGGPNLAPYQDGPIAQCVARAPGGPVHVLLSDETAEHVPGCNMTFRKSALLQIGGFDPVYRTAGDDVDVCWRLQKAGYLIGFHPAAVVWHHRRNSIKAYWKQQKAYGKAEALLERKWPEKYNGFGHLTWSGRIYGAGITAPIQFKKESVFYGTWGSALFQSIYQPAAGYINALPLMPEWYLFSGLLALIAGLGFLWSPLLWVWALFCFSIGIVVVQAARSAFKNALPEIIVQKKTTYRLLITFLHIVQPVARLYGRLRHGLTPWSQSKETGFRFLLPFRSEICTCMTNETKEPGEWLEAIEANLIAQNTRVRRGGAFHRWDLQATNSLFCNSYGLLLVEEYGGSQRLRFRIRQAPAKLLIVAVSILVTLAFFAYRDGALPVGIIVSIMAVVLIAEYIKGACSTVADLHEAFKKLALPEVAAPVLQIHTDIEPKRAGQLVFENARAATAHHNGFPVPDAVEMNNVSGL